MEVKCPRCRYRFDMPLVPGVTAIQCFCPRCGHPFSYDLDTDQDKDPKNEALTTDAGMAPPPIPSSRYAEGTVHEKNAMGERRIANRRMGPKKTTTGRWQGVFVGASRVGEPPRGTVPYSPVEKKHGCLHRLLVGVLSCVVVVIIAVRYCYSEKHYENHDVSVSNGAPHQSVQASDNDLQDDDQVADTATAKNSSSEEETPQWVEGSWHAETEYGGIDVTISGNTIAETAGDETSEGTFHYRRNTLYCDFGDGETFEYRLDLNEHCIDAGHGIYMSKIR